MERAPAREGKRPPPCITEKRSSQMSGGGGGSEYGKRSETTGKRDGGAPCKHLDFGGTGEISWSMLANLDLPLSHGCDVEKGFCCEMYRVC